MCADARTSQHLHHRPLRGAGKAMPEDARRHNRSLVLQSLFREGPLSRADLARSTHLTPTTRPTWSPTCSTTAWSRSSAGVPAAAWASRPRCSASCPTPPLRAVARPQRRRAVPAAPSSTSSGKVVDAGPPRSARPRGRRRRRARRRSWPRRLVGRRRAPAARASASAPPASSTARRRARGPEPRLARPRPRGRRPRRARGCRSTWPTTPTPPRSPSSPSAGHRRPQTCFVKIGQASAPACCRRPARGRASASPRARSATSSSTSGRAVRLRPHGLPGDALSPRRCCARLADGRRRRRRAARSLAAPGSRLGNALAPVISALDLGEVVLSGPPDLLDEPLPAAARPCHPAPRRMPGGRRARRRPAHRARRGRRAARRRRLVLDRELGVA